MVAVQEDVSDGFKNLGAQGGSNRYFEDRSAGGVGFEQRFDIGHKCLIASASITDEHGAVVDATGHGDVKYFLGAFPALGVPHVDTWGVTAVILR
jgi:hypothetical protein